MLSIPDSPSDAELLRLRVFAEAMVPIGTPTSPAENQALAHALQSYLAAPGEPGTAEITRFLQAFPGSAWRPALLANLGLLHRRTGYFTKALAAWDEALDAGGGGGRPAWPRDG